MKQLFSKCTVDISTDDLETINALIKRDTPALAIERKGTITNYLVCPECGSVLLDHSKFCHQCGQRIDEVCIAI